MPKCHNSRTDPSTRIITLAPLQGARNCAASSADSQTFAHRVSRSGLHVMGHDNHEHAPFKDHQVRKRALETLEGSCQKPDWRIDAYVLMDHRGNTPWQSGFRKCQSVIILGLTLPLESLLLLLCKAQGTVQHPAPIARPSRIEYLGAAYMSWGTTIRSMPLLKITRIESGLLKR